ncbi:hypothetical protein R5H30_05855 [Sulfitobacter sp. D35]|uniref:hypothetical protein n=1 Tax=Sulfitobacter sp. D35 TaxID=3083252 RepID=UPI00296EB887|nr:hypothetical protein [Sulfitobacter sp. D35]MDW4497498.1 hypothetical protein [Sulfitobacter sp. D35]
MANSRASALRTVSLLAAGALLGALLAGPVTPPAADDAAAIQAPVEDWHGNVRRSGPLR